MTESYRLYHTERTDGRGIVKRDKYITDDNNFLIGQKEGQLYSTSRRLIRVNVVDNALGHEVIESDKPFQRGTIIHLSRGENPAEEMAMPAIKHLPVIMKYLEVPRQNIEEAARRTYERKKEYDARVQEIRIKHQEGLNEDVVKLGTLEDFLKE